MEAQAIPTPDTTVDRDRSDPTPEPRLPLGELLPKGTTAAAVAVVSVALAVTSFADFGASGRALVGAVLCPVLIVRPVLPLCLEW